MPTERYFCDAPLQLHSSQNLDGAEFHHMVRVMRTHKGDTVELVNGKGVLAQATVQEIGKERAILSIDSLYQEPHHPAKLILAQALPKQNRLDFILEKGTELGVDAFWLFPGSQSAKKEIYPNQIERARAITIAAMKQCGRLTLPEVLLYPSLERWEPFQSPAFFGDVASDAPRFEDAWKKMQPASYPLIFVTGPESGFSHEEEAVLKHLGATGIKLHTNILRTETASLMALSLMSHWLMRQDSATR